MNAHSTLPHPPAAEPAAPSPGRGPLLLVLATAVIPRLAYVWAPIVGWHGWRQADTAAMARNFYRDGMNLLYPAIDWSGAGPGYVESEFPLFQFLVAGLYHAFGLHVVWGRILAILFSVGASLYLARLCGRYVDRWTAALAAAAFNLFPLNTYIGAAFMPEALMLFASVAAIHHMDQWSRTGRERDRWISALFLAIAISVKLPELFLGVPIAYLVWRRLGWRMFTRARVWLCAAVALAPPALWYAHAHRLKELTGLTFGIWEVGSDKWGNLDLLLSPSFYSKLVFSSLIERHLAFAGFFLAIIGWVMLRHRRDLGTFKWWLGGAILYLLVVARGNAVHDYYQLPVLLPLSLWAGAGMAWALRPGQRAAARIGGRVLVLAFLILSLVRINHFFGKLTGAEYLVDVGRAVGQVVEPDALVVAVGDGSPILLYHVDRKGWLAGVEMLTEEWIDARRLEGAAYIVALATQVDGPEAASKLAELERRFVNRSSRADVYLFDLGSR